MREHVVILALAVVVAGCSSANQDPSLPPGAAGAAVTRSKVGTANSPVPAGVPSTPEDKLIVVPDNLLAGKVAIFNAAGRFVVIYFPSGNLPAIDQRMGVYRRGLKVGEVKFSGPQRDDNIVADLVEGEASPGDEVRAD